MTLRILENQLLGNGIIDRLYDDNTYIGYCRKIIHENKYLWIDWIETNPKSQGYGKRFIQKYKEIAIAHGCIKIECEPQGNQRSLNFWENKVNFRNVGRHYRSGTYPPDLSDPIYRKYLKPGELRYIKYFIRWCISKIRGN